jgi:hypothetical protein
MRNLWAILALCLLASVSFAGNSLPRKYLRSNINPYETAFHFEVVGRLQIDYGLYDWQKGRAIQNWAKANTARLEALEKKNAPGLSKAEQKKFKAVWRRAEKSELKARKVAEEANRKFQRVSQWLLDYDKNGWLEVSGTQ